MDQLFYFYDQCTFTMDEISPVRPSKAPPFRVGEEAELRVNLEQAPAIRPESREVHNHKNIEGATFVAPLSYLSPFLEFHQAHSRGKATALTPLFSHS